MCAHIWLYYIQKLGKSAFILLFSYLLLALLINLAIIFAIITIITIAII